MSWLTSTKHQSDKIDVPVKVEKPLFMDVEKETTLMNELSIVLNKYSVENESDTPDFILAEYLRGCLITFAKATNKRRAWYGYPENPTAERN